MVWLRAKTLEHQALLEVVEHAVFYGVSLPEAVEAVRKAIRDGIRRHRKNAKAFRRAGKFKMADYATKIADREVRHSARIRRLQLKYKSWQGVAQ